MAFLGTYTRLDTQGAYTIDLSNNTTWAADAGTASATIDWANEEIDVAVIVRAAGTEPFEITHTDGTPLVVITPLEGQGARMPVAYRVELEDESSNIDWFDVEIMLAPDSTQIIDPQTSVFYAPVRLFGTGDFVILPSAGHRGYFRDGGPAARFEGAAPTGFATSDAARSITVTGPPAQATTAFQYGNAAHMFALQVEVQTASRPDAVSLFPPVYYVSPAFAVTFQVSNLFRAAVPSNVRPVSASHERIEVAVGTQFITVAGSTVTFRADAMGVRRFALRFRDTSKAEDEQVVHVHYGLFHVRDYLGRATTQQPLQFVALDGFTPPTIVVGDDRTAQVRPADPIPPPTLTSAVFEGTMPPRPPEVPMHFVLGQMESHKEGIALSLEDPARLAQPSVEPLTDPLFDWPARILAFRNAIPWPRNPGGEEED